MRVPHETFAIRVRAGNDLDRALARYSALETAWRYRDTHPPLVGVTELATRLEVARIRLEQSIAASYRATARDTKWSLAMRRARRLARGRK